MANKKKIPARQQESITNEEIMQTEKSVETENEQSINESASEKHSTTEITLPYKTTIAVSLAVLRKNIAPDTCKPVATLKQGDKVTVVAVSGEYAQLKNGLWVAVECLADLEKVH